MNETQKKMIEKCQCPGCVCSSSTDCERLDLGSIESCFYCAGHVPGTMAFPGGSIMLGMPRGFNKVGEAAMAYNRQLSRDGKKALTNIRMYESGNHPEWDKLNVPVWAMKENGYLFVRTYLPRINHAYVDVVENGTMLLVPGAIDVGEFCDEID